MYRKKTTSWLKHIDFILLDLICLHLAFVLSYMIRHGFHNPYASGLYRNSIIVVSLISIVVSVFFETFKNVLKRGYYREFSVTVKHAFLVTVATMVYLFMVKDGSEYSRFTLILMGVMYCFITYLVRIYWKRILKKNLNTVGTRSLLLVTWDTNAEKCIRSIRDYNYQSFSLAGIVILNRDRKGEVIEGVPVVANMDDMIEYMEANWVDEVFFNMPVGSRRPLDLMEKVGTMGVVVHEKLAKDSYFVDKKQFVEKMGTYTVLTTAMNNVTVRQACMKRIMDICGGIVGCVITGIAFLFVAPIIKIQSPGPVFFSQTRIGRNGKKIKIYKFRTMYLDAEERKKELMKENRMEDDLMFKMECDPRVIGNKILPDGTKKYGIMEKVRQYSIDELPQFYNVLKGDMSLVGTRPPTVDEVENYSLHHHARLAIKPGITGMWQVSGRSNITDFEEVVKLDTQYISEWSIGLDLRIIFKTVQVVLKKEGSM